MKVINIAVDQSARMCFGVPRLYADAFYKLGAWRNVSSRFQRRIWRDVVLPSDMLWTEDSPVTRVIVNENAKL